MLFALSRMGLAVGGARLLCAALQYHFQNIFILGKKRFHLVTASLSAFSYF